MGLAVLACEKLHSIINSSTYKLITNLGLAYSAVNAAKNPKITPGELARTKGRSRFSLNKP